jgi:phosphoribosyl 1,2-cyclic phosphodiesterase
VRITLLGSGSRGNALIVETGTLRLAVDVGFGPRALASRLRSAGIAPESVAGAVLTHEHQDHAQGALDARVKWRWTLLGNAETLAALGPGQASARLAPLPVGIPTAFEDLRLTLVPVPHDAAAPVAIVVEDARSGQRVGVATDLGAIPAGFGTVFRDLDILVLESNHDSGLLRDGPYPAHLKRRIAGGRGHLSNAAAAAWLADAADARLRHVVLAHLSETNNTPALALAACQAGLRRAGSRATLVAASQREVVMVGPRPSGQYDLW